MAQELLERISTRDAFRHTNTRLTGAECNKKTMAVFCSTAILFLAGNMNNRSMPVNVLAYAIHQQSLDYLNTQTQNTGF